MAPKQRKGKSRGLPMHTSKTPIFALSFMYLRSLCGLIQWPKTAHYSLTESDTYVSELQKTEAVDHE